MTITRYVDVGGRVNRLSGGAPSLNPPGTAQIVGVVAGDASLATVWVAPTSNGSSPITGYTLQVYRQSDGSLLQTASPGNVVSATVTGLTNGVPVFVTVAAVNAIGTGAASAPSAVVTPLAAVSGGGAGYGGAPAGWQQVRGVTNGVPLGLSGTDFDGNSRTDTRTAVTLVSPTTAGLVKSSGSWRITSAGTYNALDFDTQILISATNGVVHLKNCRIKGPATSATSGQTCFYLIDHHTATSAPTFTDCEFDGNGTHASAWGGSGPSGGAPSSVFYPSVLGPTVTRCWSHRLTHSYDSFTGNAVVDQCSMTDPIQWFNSSGAVSHNDQMQWFSGGTTGVTVTNCEMTLYNTANNFTGNTCNIQVGSSWTAGAVMHNILIDSCVFSASGTYLTRFDGMSAVNIASFTVSNSRWDINPSYGICSGWDSRIIKTNNTYAKTGPVHINATQTISVTAGQLIP